MRLARERAGAAFVKPGAGTSGEGDKEKMPSSHRNAADLAPLPPVNEKFKNYIEYDFSTMKDTKGGYLADDDGPSQSSGPSLESWQSKRQIEQGPLPFDHPDAPRCFECNSPELNFKYYDIFKCRVCRDCENKYPEKYSLLTKTECKEDYLLTDPELRDTELLAHMEKPNPHKSTFNNMMLYMRYQVEEYAFKKWNGPEGLDAEYERRVQDKKKRKEKKFLEKLRDMRRKTRSENITKKGHAKHLHDWIVMSNGVDDDGHKTINRKCTICGMLKEELVLG